MPKQTLTEAGKDSLALKLLQICSFYQGKVSRARKGYDVFREDTMPGDKNRLRELVPRRAKSHGHPGKHGEVEERQR